jgi:pyrroloquinoline quinone biosynthesis protein E
VDAGRPRAREASTGELLALLQEAAPAGVTSVGWSGGEPLLRKDVEELTAAATALGIQAGIATNGYLASRSRLVALRRAGLRVIQVSLDGPDPARAQRYRVGPRDAFARAYRAVQESAALGLQAYVATLLVPETAGEVEEMVALATGAGAVGLRYATFLPVGRASGAGHDERAWARREVGELLRVVRERGRAPVRVVIDCPAGPLPGMRRFSCGAGRETAYVAADGELYPCTSLMHPDYRVGNVLERPLGVLLNAGRMFKAPRQLAGGEAHGSCARCGFVVRCRSGCPGRTLAIHGRIRARGRRLSMPDCLRRLHSKSPEGEP